MMIDRARIERISDTGRDLWIHLVFANGASVVTYKRHLVNVFDWQEGWPYYRDEGGRVQEGDLVDVMASGLFAPDNLEVIAFAGRAEASKQPEPETPRLLTDTFRIGVVELPILPDQITVRRTSDHTAIPTLRAGTPIRDGKGHTHIEIEVDAIFPDAESANSFSRGLRGILASFRRAPFLPVENIYLNVVHEVQAVALADIQLETLSMVPGAILARLILLPFNHLAYMPHVPDFAQAVNRPVLEWYLRRGLIDPKPDAASGDPVLKPLPDDIANPRYHGLSIDYIQWPEEDQLFRESDEASYPDARIYYEVMQAVNELEQEASGSRRGDGWYVIKNDPGITAFHGIHYAIIVFIWGLRDETLIGTGHSYDFEFTNAPWFAANLIETYGKPDLILCKGGKAGPGWSDISQRALDRFQTRLYEVRQRLDTAIEPHFRPFEFARPEDIIVTGITAGHQNIFSTLQPLMSEWPVYQFLGQKELRCKVEMEVLSDEALQSIIRLFEYAQSETRRQATATGNGFLWLKNPVTELMGMKYVMLDTLNVRKRPHFPGHYQVQMIFVDFDVLQVTMERSHTITKRGDQFVLFEGDTPADPTDLPPGYVAKGADLTDEWARVIDLMRTISAYPDLDLPTWDELAGAFNGIPQGVPPNVGAEGEDLRSGSFVDPDFYFIFDPTTAETQVKSWILRRMMGRRELRFWLADNEQRIPMTFGRPITVDAQPMIGMEDEGKADPEFGSGPEPLGIDDIEKIKGFVHDEMIYSGAGRMIRAFPTFSLWLIDEGRWIWWARTWDNFYSLGAVSSIEINRSRKRPADSCVITLSNVYGYLTDEDGIDDPQLTIRRTEWWRQLLPEYFNLSDEQMRELRSKPRNELPIGPGARMHVRMGYGGNVAALPIVFNGSVSEFHPGPVATLVGVGDGIELTHKIMADPYQTTKELGHNNDPRNSIIQLLMLPGDMRVESSWLEREWAALVDMVNRTPKGPVQHFGSPTRWYLPVIGYMIAEGELGQNIYSVRKTKYPTPNWWEIWKIFQDQGPRIELSLHERTVWDVIRNYQLTAPNFIAAVHPFEFRSTLFFGLPQWELEYGYDFAPIPRNFPRSGMPLLYTEVYPASTDTKGWVNYRNRFFIRPKRKPYSQWHIYSSLEDILANNITASSQNLVHNVVATYLYDRDMLTAVTRGPEQREMYARADEQIYPHLQRWEIVNTNMYITSSVPIIDAFPIIGGIRAAFEQWKRWRFDDAIAFNYAASVVRESMEEMYQGYLTVVGDATVKPYDTIYLADYYSQMYGGIGVRSVTHHLSLETGFITNIEPDALVSNKDPERHSLWSWFGTLSLAVLSDHMLASVYGRAITSLGARLLSPGLPGPLTGLAGKSLAGALGTAARWAALSLRRHIGFTVGRMLMGVAGASTATVSLLTLPVMIFAFDTVNQMVQRYFNGKDCVTMALLTYRGREYSAGILGRKDSVVVRPDFSDALRNLSASDREALKEALKQEDPGVFFLDEGSPAAREIAMRVNVAEDLVDMFKEQLSDLRSYLEREGFGSHNVSLVESIAEVEGLTDQLLRELMAYVSSSYPLGSTHVDRAEALTTRQSLAYTVYRVIAAVDDWKARYTPGVIPEGQADSLQKRTAQIQEVLEVITRMAEGAARQRTAPGSFQLADGNRRIVERLPETKRILIDPGHGGKDPGATGSGLVEKDLNLKVALRLAELLRDVGYEVSLTRGGDTFISLDNRAAMAVKLSPDLFLSIHHNAATSPSASGSEVFVHSTARWTRQMGQVILKNLADQLGTKSRRVGDGDEYRVIRGVVGKPKTANTHVILAELLFLTNADDAAIARRADYAESAAKALANGVIEFFTARKRFYDDWIIDTTPSVSQDIQGLAKSDISRTALSLLGVVYKPDGTDPAAGFSSGGFVSYVLRTARGVRLDVDIKPRELLVSGLGRAVEDPLEDDLIFIAVGGSKAESVNLAGLVLDPKQKLFIASIGPGDPSRVACLRWDDSRFRNSYVTFRRITWLTSVS